MSVSEHIAVGGDDNAAAPAVIIGTVADEALDADDGGDALFIDLAEIQRSAAGGAHLQRKAAPLIGNRDIDLGLRESVRVVKTVHIVLPEDGHTVGVVLGYSAAATCRSDPDAGSYKTYADDYGDHPNPAITRRRGLRLLPRRAVPALRSRAFSLIPVVVAAVPAHIYLQSAAHGSACYFAGIASGSVNTNTVTPSRLVTATSSSWLLSIFLTRYRPSPTPSLSILRERSDLWKRSKM